MIQHQHIPESFNSSDTIFHYCKLQTALEYILFDLKLRLSPRKHSIDPLENTDPFYNIISFGQDDTKKATNIEADKVRDFVISKLRMHKQACFCMNDTTNNYSEKLMLPYEYYGFLKPRMWNQYADNYKGICLAFSKNELMKNKDLIYNQIEYLEYDSLDFNNSIDLNSLKVKGLELYCADYFKKVEKTLFRKHIDYKGENEYRFSVYSENEYEYIDIKNCLIGIIVPESNLSKYSLKNINEYSTKYNVDLLYVQWHSDRLIITSKKEIEKLSKK